MTSAIPPQASRRRSLLPSFVMGMVVLGLALAQGGPWLALDAIGQALPGRSPGGPASEATLLSVQPVLRAGSSAAAPSGSRPAAVLAAADEVGFSTATTWSLAQGERIESLLPMITNTLQQRELAFEGASGPVRTFYPGEGYQKLWGRDLSTMLPSAQYLYGDIQMRSGVEELLARQYTAISRSAGGDNGVTVGAGALPGYVAPDGALEKNTVTSDEETLVIHAAYLYYRLGGGEEWLSKNLAGATVLNRLNNAMEWLYNARFDTNKRLIKRGHTTDWGDVKFEPALDPTDFDPKSDHWTASIYDQALAYRALRELAEMNQAAGRGDQAGLMSQRAGELQEATNRLLWMPERGYFRTHIHISALKHTFDEDAIVSIANAIAVYAGLTSPEQGRTIFQNLENARRAAGVSKPGLSLYPAYPTGFFATVQRNRGEYQNGGVWDWWGGMQVLAEFRQGYSELAYQHLAQIAADWATHPGTVYEWSLPGATQGNGSKGYAGAAATVGEAVISGLYGVSIDREAVEIAPRLGRRNGYVHAYQPATGLYASYRYTATESTLTLRFGSNGSKGATVRLLVPAGQSALQAWLDASGLAMHKETVGDDSYLTVKAPAGIHTLLVALSAPVATAPVGKTVVDAAFEAYYARHSGQRILGAAITPAFLQGGRLTQYFERGKIEDMRQEAKDAAWQYGYGLLGEELLAAGPSLPVGGERSTVTYATLKEMAAIARRVAPPRGYKGGVHEFKDESAFIPFTADLKPANGHVVAPLFWYVLANKQRSPGGWLHDVGLPLTEPVWATVDKGSSTGRKVQIQAFQRAILVYDPQNKPGLQVERWELGADYLKTFPDRLRP